MFVLPMHDQFLIKRNEFWSTKQDNSQYFPMVLLAKFNASLFTFSATQIKCTNEAKNKQKIIQHTLCDTPSIHMTTFLLNI